MSVSSYIHSTEVNSRALEPDSWNLDPTGCVVLGRSRVLNIQHAWESLAGLVKFIAGPTPRVSDSVDLGWDPRICIPNKFTGDTDAIGPGTIF